ncbi:MAG: hypothetical protein CVV12_03500 [Gammaproteobacteria bacterium HGW-Gammaproteobacteria-2]|jgi:hypothetical protein|nr:MAG: hypothetical protein CVV12_03500 [Gammaproteobacteria bacterium HGW-Gammaproteobacteria-2]
MAWHTVLLRWLPGGQRRVAEYVARNATGDKGGDLVALVAGDAAGQVCKRRPVGGIFDGTIQTKP